LHVLPPKAIRCNKCGSLLQEERIACSDWLSVNSAVHMKTRFIGRQAATPLVIRATSPSKTDLLLKVEVRPTLHNTTATRSSAVPAFVARQVSFEGSHKYEIGLQHTLLHCHVAQYRTLVMHFKIITRCPR
jgi:hypothetical protein